MVLVQTKIDLEPEAAMTPEEIEGLRSDLDLEIFKTCAKDNTMVTEVFESLGGKFLDKRSNQSA